MTGTSCLVSLCFVDVKIGQDMNIRSLVFEFFCLFTLASVWSNVDSERGGTEVHEVFQNVFSKIFV